MGKDPQRKRFNVRKVYPREMIEDVTLQLVLKLQGDVKIKLLSHAEGSLKISSK